MAMADAATEMWSRTDLKPADLQVAQLYDGFTYLTLAWLEALGCAPTVSRARSSKAEPALPATAPCH